LSIYRLISQHLKHQPEPTPIRSVVVVALSERGRVGSLFYSSDGPHDEPRITSTVLQGIGRDVAAQLIQALELAIDHEPDLDQLAAGFYSQRKYRELLTRLS
jgi:hypothetical protein